MLDYDGPLSEAGDTTLKYHALKALIKLYASENSSKSLTQYIKWINQLLVLIYHIHSILITTWGDFMV